MSAIRRIVDRMQYRMRWGRFLPLVAVGATVAVLVNDEAFKFALGMLLGIIVARFALEWEVL